MGKQIKQFFEGQESLPFKTNTGLWAAVHPWERRAVIGIVTLILLTSVVYMYFVLTSVMNVAAHEELSIQANKLSAQVATLEAEYLSRTSSITETYAKSTGFVAVSARSFVERPDSLSLNASR